VPFRYPEGGRFGFRVRVPRLALSEGDYSIGVYVVTDDFAEDLLEIAELRVGAKRFQQDFAPYASSARGFLSLDAEAVVPIERQPLVNTGVKED
jgi:hypothetical protein